MASGSVYGTRCPAVIDVEHGMLNIVVVVVVVVMNSEICLVEEEEG
jgi:hypothetical protein